MPLFVPLDVTWPDDESIIEVGLEGAGAHAFIMCIAKRSESDGWVGRRALARYGVTDEILELLRTCEPEPLIEQRDDGAVRSAGWHKRNPSQDAIDAKRAAKAEAGKRGNHTRWKHAGEYESCAQCHAEDSLVVAGSDRTVSQSESHGIATHSPESEAKAVAASDPTGSHDANPLGFAGPRPTAIDDIRAIHFGDGTTDADQEKVG